ncbi:MAG: hypothetical protein M3Q08_00275 [Pseudomonadota bacterium]|nr:hypothetical protein [Pseudomonadota bacterium]
MTDAVGVPAFVQAGGGVLQNVFQASSNNDISLVVNTSGIATPLAGHQQGFWAYDLHVATVQLTSNPPPPGPAQSIAVLFADYYKPFPPALGVMFDRGFDPGDDPSSDPVFRQRPREGCAIFLKAIANLRKTPNQAQQEALFTTIHEMGHLFNLQHRVTPKPHFMSQSSPLGAYDQNAYHFVGPDRNALAHCSSSKHVWPGGEKFKDTSDFANLNVARRRATPPPEFGLELIVSMGQREFWRFEPVELDVALRVASGIDRRFRVPDALDPGYEQFDIWIEEPSGERRRLHSPRHYCGPIKTRTVTPSRPFRRDISLFGQSGGYTFRRAGPHRIWAEFSPRQGVRLLSNDLEVNVRERSSTRTYELARRVLTASPRARLLYHRLPRGNLRQLQLLTDYADSSPELGSVGSIRYAVGRSLLLCPTEDERSKELAEELLRRAADNPLIGEHQRELATAATRLKG